MKLLLIALTILILSNCGVKGKPLPPDVPTYIGTGKFEIKQAPIKKKNKNNINQDLDSQMPIDESWPDDVDKK